MAYRTSRVFNYGGNMRVLGIDPGFGRTGWSVIEGSRSRQVLVEYGCLETSPDDSLSERLEEIYEHMIELVAKFKPEAAVALTHFFVGQPR